MEDIHKKIEELYKAVHEETKPLHNDPPGKRKVFRPILKRLHHLHPHGSKMVRNPLAIIGDWLYMIWGKVRDFFKKLHQKIFPKNEDFEYGVENDGSVVGKITFSARSDANVPMHHLDVELWGRTRLGFWRKIGESETNVKGEFSIPYDLNAITALWLRKNLRLEILQDEGVVYDKNGIPHPRLEVFESIKVPKAGLVGLKYDMGLIQLHYWEYRIDTLLPRVQITDVDNNPPQHYEQGRMDAISLQFIPVELITLKVKEKLHRHPNKLSLEDIQDYYPVNMTHGMDDEVEGISRTDEYFGWRMMNGVYANIFDKWPDDPSTYWIHYHWSSYDHKDDTYIFPDVTCKFKLVESGYLMPSEIMIRGALKKGEPTQSRRSFKPGDPHWDAAKRIARVQGALSAQIDKHFVGTHVNVEQFAIAFHRNVQRNPIGQLFHPHMRGITLINHMADKILVNEGGYITRTCALTGKGLEKRCLDTLGTHDWKNYRPVEPLSDKHTYAIVSNLYWDIVNQFVSEYVEENKEMIIKEWHEIFTFSNDLVEHSVPVFLCNYLEGHQRTEGPNLGDWFTKSGRMDLSLNRKEENGQLKALSPITGSPKFNPESDDLANLIQVATYVIYQATMGHFWSNFQQYDDIGELKYSTLGLRYGDGPDGALGDEDDVSIAPSKELCIETMWWANMLSRTGYGFIMKNEDKDINPRLIELMKENESKFAKYNFNIYDLQSRTNI